MTKKTILLIAVLVFAGLCLGATVTSDPWTGVGWNTSAPNDEALVGNTYKELQDLRKGVELRANREHLTYASSSVGGWHRNGSAVCYEGTTEEPNLPDDSAALSNIARDRGRLWLDDNFDPPALKRWDGSAYEVIGTIASGSAPIAYLISDANEDTDGGRESKIIFKGEKDDDTLRELIMIQGSHDGTGDDYKADLIFFLNDGDDADGSLTEVLRIDSAKLATFAGAATVAGTITASGAVTVGTTLDVTGNIDPTTYETTNGGFLDEDDMASDANDNVASQQSIKAYVDNQNVSHAAQIKGWVRFDGSGNMTPDDSYNVSSITDNGTGDYTINWDTDFANANYCVVGSAWITGSTGISVDIRAIATGTTQIQVFNGGSKVDATIICITAIGDQ